MRTIMSKDIKEAVAHVADLAKLELDGEKLEKYTENTSKIIEYFNKLNELNTDDVLPTAHAIEVMSILREDKVVKCKEVREIIDQVPEKDGPFIQVPKVL
jgi:aspartyl-tRNA(Asn)/glutamyl-tRNA(Gln) amidotransferase subunit C